MALNRRRQLPEPPREREKETSLDRITSRRASVTEILMSSVRITLHAHEGVPVLHLGRLKWTLGGVGVLTVSEGGETDEMGRVRVDGKLPCEDE